MATADQIRRTIRQALANAGESAIEVAKALGWNRHYLRDFMIEKKSSLDTEFMLAISDRYSIPIKELTKTKSPPDTIRKGAHPHLYITEHMEARGYDDQDMAHRIDGVPAKTVESWRSDPSKLQDWQLRAVLHALDMEEAAELTRLPSPAKRPQKAPRAARKRA